MQKRIPWVILAVVTLALMVLASCAPASTTAPATTTSATTTTPPKTTAATTAPSDKPQYGGTVTLMQATNYSIFGAAVSNRGTSQDGTVYEQITFVDRTKGPAGSGVSDYGDGPTSMDDVVGKLAAKWTTPETGVWVLDIRQGVRFANNVGAAASALINGREMTADDVKASLEFLRDTPSSWVNVAEPTLIKNMTVEKTGPWQVTVKTPVSPNTGYLWLMGGGGSSYVWAKEWLPRYGTSNDWRDMVGTGPYILTDWVDNSVATYKRNSNYWDKNPVGPGKGDQLPYADGVKILIIPDTSTQLAAMRTGKVDLLIPPGITQREDAENLLKTNPGLKTYKTLILPLQVGMRRDKQDLPYKDKRVRQALMLATDQPGILSGLYSGQGELLDSPARKLYSSVYTPLDKLPQSTQELYGYNPEKAKQLLKEAGYPSGFKAKMVVSNLVADVDMAQTIKAQWAKVGVDVEIQVKEPVVFQTIWTSRNYEDLMLTANAGGNAALFVRYSFGYYRGPNSYNISYVNDPIGTDAVVEKAFQDQAKVVMVDYPKCDQIMKELIPYILDNAFLIPMPAPYGYRVWQPWLKNYYGEGSTKNFIQYVWVDQDLKARTAGK